MVRELEMATPPPPMAALPLQPPTTVASYLNSDRYSSSPVTWSSGLFDCFNDIDSCCLTFWCPCISFGRIAEIVDRGSTSCGISGTLYMLIMCVTGCSCLYSCFYRSKLRGQFMLEESACSCSDCCVHLCCEGCALCQEYRELMNQGYDLSIGWHGNVQRKKRQASMLSPPTMHAITR